ncbi:MAG: CinA family protein [Clostridiales bacterium]|jgi:nicotinamide-nucleotide amidase|nr:CinA family protein [Clostridiales bacterium]
MKVAPIKKRTKAEESELVYNAFSRLASTGRKLSVAESFTGGLIASLLIALPGASAFFYEGVVAYADAAKCNRLGVKPDTVKRHTAVSVEAAYEMAVGLLSDPCADLVIATTGYAGPSAPDEGLIGHCCIAVGDRNKLHIYKYQFSGGRENIMRSGALEALILLTELI